MAEILTLADAVASLVEDGQTVALEGFTHLIPHAAGHELVRQGRRELTLVRMTPDIVYDQLIGMGTGRKLVFSWGGNPGVGSLHRFRDAVENDWPLPLELEEHSHAGMAGISGRKPGWMAVECNSSWIREHRTSRCARRMRLGSASISGNPTCSNAISTARSIRPTMLKR